jgi:hypothetical protein
MAIDRKGHKNPKVSRKAIGDFPFFSIIVQLKIKGSKPSCPQISVSGSSIRPRDMIQTRPTMIHARTVENMSKWCGK